MRCAAACAQEWNAAIGSIYAGIATPTEAASLGVVGALIQAAASKTPTLNMLREAVKGTMRTTVMIVLLMIYPGIAMWLPGQFH